MAGAHDYALELFESLPNVRIKRMFGGAGVYAGDVMFGLIDDGVIYLKTDEALRAELAAQGSTFWIYSRKDGTTEQSSYWRLPDSALDDPDEATRWGRRALAVAAANKSALRKRAAKKKRAV